MSLPFAKSSANVTGPEGASKTYSPVTSPPSGSARRCAATASSRRRRSISACNSPSRARTYSADAFGIVIRLFKQQLATYHASPTTVVGSPRLVMTENGEVRKWLAEVGSYPVWSPLPRSCRRFARKREGADTEPRAERARVRPEHADEPDPGDRRRHRRAAGRRTSSGRSATRCSSSPAPTARPPIRSTSRSATTPRSRASGARPATSSSTARSTCATSATTALHRAEQLLALALQPDDQRRPRRASAVTPASSGRSRRPRRCGACTSTGRPR